jgi:hypothetical protein
MRSAKNIRVPLLNVKSRRTSVAARLHRQHLPATVKDVSPERETLLLPKIEEISDALLSRPCLLLKWKMCWGNKLLCQSKINHTEINKCLSLYSAYRRQCSYVLKNLQRLQSLICSVWGLVILRFPLCCLLCFNLLQATECIWPIKYLKRDILTNSV